MLGSHSSRCVARVLALVPLALACTHSVSTTSSTTSSTAPLNVTTYFPARAKPDPVPGMVVIDIESGDGFEFRQEIVSTTGQPVRNVMTCNGEAFEVVGDELHVGTRRYGPLAAGQVVRVTKDGVLLDGKRIEPR
ncbi:MAG: hypothetical protein IPJ77_12170 [Planctomycetes bacterium]|nr:hypothetical protein [Planctomycetota bacterium]